MPSQASHGLVQVSDWRASTRHRRCRQPQEEMKGSDGIADDGSAMQFADDEGPGQTPGYSGPGVVIGLEVVNRRNRAATPVCLLLAARIPRIS
jgi:hypothetical protein